MKAELEQLIALQNTDTSIRRLQSEIEAIPARRAEIEKEFDQRAFEIRALETTRDDAHTERTRLETEIAETRAKGERAERNLMSSKNEQEYAAAIREADAARKHVSQLETQALEKMEAFESSEILLKERAPEQEKLRAEMEERFKSFEEQTRIQMEQLAARRTEREQLLAALPKNVNTLYKRISARIRDGVAVAEAKNGACTACFMALRPQVMSEVRRGEEIVTCDNCNRILYYAPSVETTQTKAVSAASTSSEAATS